MTDLLKVGDTLNSNGTITSLELLEQINLFRKEEDGRSELRHDTLRDIIKDEFEEEILSQQILEKSIPSNGGRPTLVYSLTLNQAKQILVRESKFVRKAVIAYIDKLESCIKHLLPQTFSEALQLAANQAKEIEEKNALLLEQAPKVLFSEAVAGSTNSCLVGELAKIITQNGYEIGQNRLFQWFRDNGYMGKSGERYNIPNQQYIEQGLFEVKKGTRSGNGGVMFTTITPKITGKGQVYFVNKFLGQNK